MESAKVEPMHIGFGNMIDANSVVAIATPKSAAIKRSIQEGKDKGLLIDMTKGRKTRAVIFTDSGHIILVAPTPKTIALWLTSKSS